MYWVEINMTKKAVSLLCTQAPQRCGAGPGHPHPHSRRQLPATQQHGGGAAWSSISSPTSSTVQQETLHAPHAVNPHSPVAIRRPFLSFESPWIINSAHTHIHTPLQPLQVMCNLPLQAHNSVGFFSQVNRRKDQKKDRTIIS